MTLNRNNDPGQRAAWPNAPGLLGYVAAAGLALPVGALFWFESVYLYFGLRAEDPPALFNMLAAIGSFGFAIGWPLWRAPRPAWVVRRACRLGMVAAVMLPTVAFAVLALWESASGRPDLGMGGMMLYALPFIGLGVAAVLLVAFWIGGRMAARRLRPDTKGH